MVNKEFRLRGSFCFRLYCLSHFVHSKYAISISHWKVRKTGNSRTTSQRTKRERNVRGDGREREEQRNGGETAKRSKFTSPLLPHAAAKLKGIIGLENQHETSICIHSYARRRVNTAINSIKYITAVLNSFTSEKEKGWGAVQIRNALYSQTNISIKTFQNCS